MAAREFPVIPGVVVLENPEVGCGVRLDRDYTLEEIAELHVVKLRALGAGQRGDDEPLTICGYSMGGMIAAVMGTLFRSRLPRRTEFVFLTTAPRFGDQPVTGSQGDIPAAVRNETEDEYRRALAPYFSEEFLARNPARFNAYVRYRALGLNGQSREALFRQIWAMQRCQAAGYFARLDPDSCTFLGSRGDRIFGPAQNEALRALCPGARHLEHPAVGHMVHHEAPELIRDFFPMVSAADDSCRLVRRGDQRRGAGTSSDAAVP